MGISEGLENMKYRVTDKRQLVTLYRSSDGGLKYRGQVLNDLYDGWGEARHRNGSTYHGYWNEGKRHGHGEAKTYVYTKIDPRRTNGITSNINCNYLYNTQDFSYG